MRRKHSTLTKYDIFCQYSCFVNNQEMQTIPFYDTDLIVNVHFEKIDKPLISRGFFYCINSGCFVVLGAPIFFW